MTWTINLSGHVPHGQEQEVEDAARGFVQSIQHLGLTNASCSTMGKGYINLLADTTADEGPGTLPTEPPPDEEPGRGPGLGGGGGD